MLRKMAARIAQGRTRPAWRTSSVPNDLPPELQAVLDRNPNVDWEYVEGYFDNMPESEWDALGLEEYMDAYRTYREGTVLRRANESDLEELGMSADYGPDQDSMSTHTDLEEEDLETTDTRTSLERRDGA